MKTTTLLGNTSNSPKEVKVPMNPQPQTDLQKRIQESVNTHASKTQGRKQDYLVIHCTATPEGRNVTSAEIKIWHTSPPPKGNGWKHVGYTHIFHLNGGVEQLVANDDDGWVDTWEVTNGVAGYNSNSKHICVVGGLSKDGKTAKDTRTPEQKKSLEKFVKDFHKKHPTVHICGHNELASKACPSFDVQAWLKSIGIKNPKIY